MSDISGKHSLCMLTAMQNVAATGGAVQVLRNVADQMYADIERGKPILTGAVDGWLTILDFIGNVMSDRNDELIDALRSAGYATALCSGTVVDRSIPVAPTECAA